MKRVILLGAIAPFCDLVYEMEHMGIYPVICDYYSDAPAKKMGYPAYDISTMDLEKLLQIAKFHHVDGVMSAFSDRNLFAAYEIGKQLDLPQLFELNKIELLTDKRKMKAFFLKARLPVIKYCILKQGFEVDDLKQMHFPMVVKPVDAYGSKGIFVCNNVAQIRAHFQDVICESLKYQDQIIVEEFYLGDEISINAWVKDGHPYLTCIYDVIRNYGSDIQLAAVSFPSKYVSGNTVFFEKLLEHIVKKCKIQNGPVTLQCFIGNEGIKIGELLYRLAGGSTYLYTTYLGGPNLAKMQIQYSIGNPIDYQNLETYKLEEQGIGDGIVYFDIQFMTLKQGKIYYSFTGTDIEEKINGCVDFRLYFASGTFVHNTSKNGQLLARGIFKLEMKNDHVYEQFLEQLEKEIQIYNEGGSCISFIRKPDHFSYSRRYHIDWSFMNKWGRDNQ